MYAITTPLYGIMSWKQGISYTLDNPGNVCCARSNPKVPGRKEAWIWPFDLSWPSMPHMVEISETYHGQENHSFLSRCICTGDQEGQDMASLIGQKWQNGRLYADDVFILCDEPPRSQVSLTVGPIKNKAGIGLDKSLAPNWRQVIIRLIDGLVYWRIYVLSYIDELFQLD